MERPVFTVHFSVFVADFTRINITEYAYTNASARASFKT